MKQLSILLPSGPNNSEKLARTLANLRETISDMSQIEVVVCLDAEPSFPDGWIDRIGDNLIRVYAAPSKYRGRFFDAAWKASTGRFLLMMNDDALFKTKGWDKMIPYDKYPDDLVVFGFKDNQFNDRFFCHPIWSRRAMEMGDNLFGPNYWITKCDNTVWDIHPPNRRVYLETIELEHRQTPYGPEWAPAYEYDNKLYLDNIDARSFALNKIVKALGLDKYRVMIGISTAEYARRADFYDWVNSIQKPANTVQVMIHGQAIAHNRNEIVKQALIHGCTHIFFIDDDVLCKGDILYKLLAHDVDIVCALQLRRHFPHEALAWDFDMRPIALTPDVSGLVRIKGAGLGACLIKTDVFKHFTQPIFRTGQIKGYEDMIGEDTDFFNRAFLAFHIHCDTDVRVGHIGSVSIWPEKVNGQWMSTYNTMGGNNISIPAAIIAPIIDTAVEA